mmetsp:Transcript_3977/g.9268  ORF Transcript_3977/g.9268 Transcript_3977/m.9268 type:complete len:82 (+) Transcript_3977:29-274(+)
MTFKRPHVLSTAGLKIINATNWQQEEMGKGRKCSQHRLLLFFSFFFHKCAIVGSTDLPWQHGAASRTSQQGNLGHRNGMHH